MQYTYSSKNNGISLFFLHNWSKIYNFIWPSAKANFNMVFECCLQNRTNRICLLKTSKLRSHSSNVFYLYFLFLRLCMCSWFYNKTHHLLNWGHDTSQGRITQNNTAYDSCTEREQELLERIPAYDKGVNLSDRQTVILFFFFCSFPEEQHAFNLFCQWPCKTTQKAHTPL